MIESDHIQLVLGYSTEAARRLVPDPIIPQAVFHLSGLLFLDRLKLLLHERVLSPQRQKLLGIEWAAHALILASGGQQHAATQALATAAQHFIGQVSTAELEAAIATVDVTREVEYMAVGAALRGNPLTCARWMLDPKAIENTADVQEFLDYTMRQELRLFGK